MQTLVPSAPAASTKTPTQGTWRVEHRSGSGTYIVSERGAMLGRLDRTSGVVFMWDKKLGGEVPVKLADLLAMCQAAAA